MGEQFSVNRDAPRFVEPQLLGLCKIGRDEVLAGIVAQRDEFDFRPQFRRLGWRQHRDVISVSSILRHRQQHIVGIVREPQADGIVRRFRSSNECVK